MTKTNQVAAFILGSGCRRSSHKIFKHAETEIQAFYNDMKKVTSQLLDNAEDTVEKVEHYMNEFKDKGEGAMDR